MLSRIWVRSKFLAPTLLVAVFLSPHAHAWLRGKVVYGLWLPTAAPENPQESYRVRQSNLSAWLEADPELTSGLSLHAKGTVDGIFQSTVLTTREAVQRGVRATFREAYAQFNKSGWDLRAGRQVIPWGKSDGINPTDFLPAKDQYLFWSDEEMKRFGSDSVQTTWVPKGGSSAWGFTVVGTFRYPRSTGLLTDALLRGGAPDPISGQPATVSIDEASRDPDPVSGSTAEFAAKTSYFGKGFDFDVIGFVGRRHLPQYAILSSVLTPQIAVRLESRYERIQAMGANASFNWRDTMFRFEGAVTQQLSTGVYQPLVGPVQIDTVFGAERLLRQKYRVQVQWLYRHFTNFEAPAATADPILTSVRRTNALIQGMLYKTRNGGTFRIAYEGDGARVQPEIFALLYFGPGESLIQPRITVSTSDSFKMIFGLSLFNGPSDQAFGALKPYSSYFAEMKYFF